MLARHLQNCGPAIVNGVLYIGSGYRRYGEGTPGTRVTRWALPASLPKGL